MTITNWSHSYRSRAFSRVCARPGCDAPAAATLRFRSTRREAWLVDVDDALPRSQGDLCKRHAGALELPRGWQLHDERSPVTEVTLVVVREPEPEATVRRVSSRGAETERLADVLDAQTPLLKRAFGNVVMPSDDV
jgi:hypothetical protein